MTGDECKGRLEDFLRASGVEFDGRRNTPVLRCPNPSHADEHPSAVLYRDSQRVLCPVCGDPQGWDVYDVAGLLNGEGDFVKQKEIVERALGVDTPVRERTKKPPARERTRPAIPLSREDAKNVYTREEIIKRGEAAGWGAPVGSWAYRDEAKCTVAMDVRFEKNGRKNVITFWYDGERLQTKDAPIVLSNRDRLAADSESPALVVEGMKTARAAEAIPGFIPVTWPGGSNRAQLPDWSILMSRDVYIYPDDDRKVDKKSGELFPPASQPGMRAALAIQKALPHARIVPPLEAARAAKADGADIVEALAVMSPGDLAAYIREAGAPREGDRPRVLTLRDRTDLGNAERMMDVCGGDIRYTDGLGWMVWNGKYWVRDERGVRVRGLASQVARGIHEEARRYADDDPKLAKALEQHATRSEAAGRIGGIVTLFGPMVMTDASAFDADPWVINTQSGILDLHTGQMKPHSPDALCTMIADVEHDPTAEAPRWFQFLEEVLPDPEVRELIQRWAGSCLTGIARDRVVMLWTGSGANGKGVLAETLAHVLGTYATAVSQRFFQRKAGDPVPMHELAQLPGKRLMFGAELKPSIPLDVELLKGLSGSDTMLACHKYQAPFQFRPQCKPIVSANHRPKVDDQTTSIWDRLKIVDFPNQFERGKNRDEGLDLKLRSEAPGILRWMLEGCAQWQRDGIGSALSVDIATNDERQAQDPLDEFFATIAARVDDARIESRELFDAFSDWAQREKWNNLWSRNKFGRALTERGFKKRSNGRAREWTGIALRDSDGRVRRQDLRNQAPIDFKSVAGKDEY